VIFHKFAYVQYVCGNGRSSALWVILLFLYSLIQIGDVYMAAELPCKQIAGFTWPIFLWPISKPWYRVCGWESPNKPRPLARWRHLRHAHQTPHVLRMCQYFACYKPGAAVFNFLIFRRNQTVLLNFVHTPAVSWLTTSLHSGYIHNQVVKLFEIGLKCWYFWAAKFLTYICKSGSPKVWTFEVSLGYFRSSLSAFSSEHHRILSVLHKRWVKKLLKTYL